MQVRLQEQRTTLLTYFSSTSTKSHGPPPSVRQTYKILASLARPATERFGMLLRNLSEYVMSTKKLRIDHPLDEQYQALYEAAMAVAAAYLEHANWLIERTEGRKLRTHLMITVRIKTPTCWVAVWTKKIDVKDTERSRAVAKKLRAGAKATVGQSLTAEMPKGEGFTYKAATFNSLPREIRELAMHYERLLSDLRKAAQENRSLRRTMANTMIRAAKVISTCEGSISAAATLRQVELAVESNKTL